MGGICAYQLADAIVVLCAPNLQNLDGTDAMVRHFLSLQVRAVRGDRPLDVLIIPAWVDQEDSTLRRHLPGTVPGPVRRPPPRRPGRTPG